MQSQKTSTLPPQRVLESPGGEVVQIHTNFPPKHPIIASFDIFEYLSNARACVGHEQLWRLTHITYYR